MSKALVCCPATDTTELIDYVDTPIGALLHGCSRFRPSTALACGRGCAAGPRCRLSESKVRFGTADVDEDEDDDTLVEIDACPRATPAPSVAR